VTLFAPWAAIMRPFRADAEAGFGFSTQRYANRLEG
jgi:hypothetical protein